MLVTAARSLGAHYLAQVHRPGRSHSSYIELLTNWMTGARSEKLWSEVQAGPLRRSRSAYKPASDCPYSLYVATALASREAINSTVVQADTRAGCHMAAATG
jgi:hypothetical protein